ncbi:hypothetical protein [Microcoleus sp. S13_B4]|uniref:hypothetical protein n=1 Tax=Microcoleus sp. S13_B4 TaxID=3055408 RepID=UPI002FCFB525
MRALSRQSLDVSYSTKVYSISLNSSLKEHWQDESATTAEVLLPEGFRVEAKALKQLASLANVRHPQGGCVCRGDATLDFYPGDAGVAIASSKQQEWWFRWSSVPLHDLLGFAECGPIELARPTQKL